MKKILLTSSFQKNPDIFLSAKKIFNRTENLFIEGDFVRFNNGEGKCILKGMPNIGDDVYIICDPFNYSVGYQVRGDKHYYSPDDHIQDIRRAVSALGGHYHSINLVMPFFYQSRQDKRNLQESLDASLFLQEMNWMGIKRILTFDIHNKDIENAIPFGTYFESKDVTMNIVNNLIEVEKVEKDSLFIVSPDNGAKERAYKIAKQLDVGAGFFDKHRNYNILENGRNPIETHVFNGPSDLSAYNVIVVDDMIASGDSLISSGNKLKQLMAKRVFFVTTFSLFTAGIDRFVTAYKDNIFNRLYTSNLSYIPEEYNTKEFLRVQNCFDEIFDWINNDL